MMTNEEAKREAIKNAWGNKWELVTSLTPKSKNNDDNFDLYNNGSFNFARLKLQMGSVCDHFPIEKFDIDGFYVTPKALKDLHKNNGWTRIEPDGGNLPALKGKYDFCINGEPCFDSPEYKPMSCQTLINTFYELQGDNEITHYKPITEDTSPIW